MRKNTKWIFKLDINNVTSQKEENEAHDSFLLVV